MASLPHEFVVAIPSFRRPHLLMSKTFALCLRWNIPLHRIHVFVVEDELAAYSSILSPYPAVRIVTGPLGLHHMRNFIADFFPEGTPILQMDDDIGEMYQMKVDESIQDVKCSRRYPLHPIDPSEMCDWIELAFATARECGSSLFGVYPVKNGYFMKDLPETTRDLRFCVGVFWGIWNRRDLKLQIQEKEDVERTLWCFERDHCVVRFNHVVPSTTYYRTLGGMQSLGTDRKLEGQASCKYLMQRWPQWCRLRTTKKSGHWEVRLGLFTP